MNRDDWKFAYKASDVCVAATKKLEFHQGRFAWWTDKRKDVIETVKREGLEIDESQSNFSSNYNRGDQIVVRNDLSRDLNECGERIRHHRAKIEDYAGWVQVLSSQGDAAVALDHEDWLHFFGGNAPGAGGQAEKMAVAA